MDNIDTSGFYKPFDTIRERMLNDEALMRSIYESPITMIASQMETKIEADTMSVIQHYGIDVNKDELIKALAYDRGQYEKGYQDGYAKGYEKAKEDLANMILRYPM